MHFLIRPSFHYIVDQPFLDSPRVEKIVSEEGGYLDIPDSGVSLDIPQGALEGKHVIQMRIVTDYQQEESSLTFSSNSSVVVELLPSSLKLLKPVKLTLPHCLALREDCEWKARIFSSHHKEGKL